MTLLNPLYKRMLILGLDGMAEAPEQQAAIAGIEELGFEDSLAMLLEHEATRRQERSFRARLRRAQLRTRADIADVSCRAGRGITHTALMHLAAGAWIRNATDLAILGATGSGKTFLGFALAANACRQQRSVLYRRVPDLTEEIACARENGKGHQLMSRQERLNLLVLDDWGLVSMCAARRRAILEVVEKRHRKAKGGTGMIPGMLEEKARLRRSETLRKDTAGFSGGKALEMMIVPRLFADPPYRFRHH